MDGQAAHEFGNNTILSQPSNNNDMLLASCQACDAAIGGVYLWAAEKVLEPKFG